MYQDNTVVTDQVTIVKNMPNDGGNLYIQVYNSKGIYIAIDKDEFERRVNEYENNSKYWQQDRKEREETQEKQMQSLRQNLRNEQQAFDQYKKQANEIAAKSLNAMTMLKRIIKGLKRTPISKAEFVEVEMFYQELIDMNGKFKFFIEQNYYSAGPQQVTNKTGLLK
jgi:ATPase subunit of ABC transporter with duplicated ATPase domains